MRAGGIFGSTGTRTKLYFHAKLLLASDLMGPASLYRAPGCYSMQQRPYVPVSTRRRIEREALKRLPYIGEGQQGVQDGRGMAEVSVCGAAR